MDYLGNHSLLNIHNTIVCNSAENRSIVSKRSLFPKRSLLVAVVLFRMRRVIFQRPQYGGWYGRWRGQMSSGRLESVFVRYVRHLYDGVVWSRVSERTGRFHRFGLRVAEVFHVALFVCCYSIFCFVTEKM